MHLLDELDDTTTGAGLAGLLLEPIGWHKYARCAEPDVDPEIFYVERGQSTKEARAVCAGCPVRAECLAFAMDDADARAWGIWGGSSPRERRAMRRREVA